MEALSLTLTWRIREREWSHLERTRCLGSNCRVARHTHTCRNGHTWSHCSHAQVGKCACGPGRVSQSEYEAAHRCPTCGVEQYKKDFPQRR